MKTYKEIANDIKSSLKNMLTADNTDAITSLDKQIDELIEQHKAQENEIAEVKDKLIDVVKNTSFKTASKDAEIGAQDKSLDEILTEELNKIK